MNIFIRHGILWLLCLFSVSTFAKQAPFKLDEKEYFASQGADLLVFNNTYPGLFNDAKMSGIELIHHGERTVTNGDVRLQFTPEQWDDIPQLVSRSVDSKSGKIIVTMEYGQHGFRYEIHTQLHADGMLIQVVLPSALPSKLVGKAAFNMEFLPSAYFERAWIMGDKVGHFPLYPSGLKEVNDQVEPSRLAVGQSLVLAPEDPNRRIVIESLGNPISLYDGRSKAQNGWFVARSFLPGGKSGVVLEWQMTPNRSPGWVRTPVITHSQVGYHPKQNKVAVVELDKNDKPEKKMRLLRLGASGEKVALQAKPEKWGKYLRYNYLTFDFSSIREAGLYVLEYAGQRSAAFPIANDVYSQIWQPTLGVYFPVQMDHVLVNEAYRVWHGASHLDDARQAPVNHEHFDLYAQGPTTDTQYKPGEHIPGLNVGGWYDAGDYDIRTQTQYRTVQNLVSAWEHFGLLRDTTSVDYPRKWVELHVADGKPDLLQQIEHGTLALLAQFRAVGHAIPGIIVPSLDQYTHLGDGLTMTDNQVFNPAMGPLESDGKYSGVADDRWAFTSETSALNYGSAAALAAASRALKEYRSDFAKECLDTAVAAWQKEQGREPKTFRHGNTTGGDLLAEELSATVELLIATQADIYRQHLQAMLPEVIPKFRFHAALLVRAIPFMGPEYKKALRTQAEEYQAFLLELEKANPFGVLITDGGWAGNGAVLAIATTSYYLHKAFPDVVSKESVYRGLNYLHGSHPSSDISFVSAVGAKSKRVAYGMNRADFSFLAGGIVPGVLLLKPDFPENKEDWPFFWGENEYVISLGATYVMLANAVQELLGEPIQRNAH